jgi:hypothetical protein
MNATENFRIVTAIENCLIEKKLFYSLKPKIATMATYDEATPGEIGGMR